MALRTFKRHLSASQDRAFCLAVPRIPSAALEALGELVRLREDFDQAMGALRRDDAKIRRYYERVKGWYEAQKAALAEGQEAIRTLAWIRGEVLEAERPKEWIH